MKRISLISAAICLVAASAVAQIDADEVFTLALKDALEEARTSLASSTAIPADKAIAILPLNLEEGNIIGLLKNTITAAGKTCVEGKEDPMWDEILKEIEWDERKEDILDPATLDKFGSLKSAQYLMYGWVGRLAKSERYVLVELELHISSIATKQHVWGGSFVRRHYAPGVEPTGAVEIPAAVRSALIDGIRAKVTESIGKSEKVKAVKSVVLLPVSGDMDGYAEGLFRDVLASSSVTPVNLDVTTRAEARFALREGPGKADAIAYGVLRDISTSTARTEVDGRETYTAMMEMQLWMEQAGTRAILWSDTVQFSKEFTPGPDGLIDTLCRYVPYFKDHRSAIVWIPIVTILGLIMLVKFMCATTRVR